MLARGTLRGVLDSELAGIDVPVVVIPSDPPNLYHQSTTVQRLVQLIPDARLARGFPEPPQPAFGRHRAAFVATVISFLALVSLVV